VLDRNHNILGANAADSGAGRRARTAAAARP